MAGPFSAGLPGTPVNSGVRDGDIKFFGPGCPLFFTDLDGEWLRAGSFIGYTPAYSGLAKKSPGWLCRDMPSAISFAGGNAFNGKMFFVDSKYSFVGGGTGGNHVCNRVGADLTLTGTNQQTSLNAVIYSVYCAARIGNSVLVGGFPTSTHVGLAVQTDNGSFSNSVSGFPAAQNLVQLMATNNVNLGVLAFQSSQSNASTIYTTTNGTAWIQRTGALGSGGSAGTLGVINAMYYSPCANAFLYVIGSNALNKTADGFTQSACTLPSGVAFNPDRWDLYAASSSTSTIILLADGRLLRTSDGNNFSVIDPTSSLCLQVSNASRIVHDGIRYIIYNNGGATSCPSFIYSDDDGVTWKNSPCFEELTAGYTNSWAAITLSVVNSKLVIGGVLGPPSNPISRLYDMTDLVTLQPTRVGSHKPISMNITSTLVLPGYINVRARL